MDKDRRPHFLDGPSTGGIEDEMAGSKLYAERSLRRLDPVQSEVDLAWNGVVDAVNAHPKVRGLHPEVIKAQAGFFKEVGRSLIDMLRRNN
jgi:hypothetical protein